jgi:predicted ATP-dependent endonuclease of OLD family
MFSSVGFKISPMEHNNFPKGSQWNKWDLHVHTPASVLNNGFGSDWDSYVQKLFKVAIEKRIIAIGITDYYLITGYKKIVQEYLENAEKLNELFTVEEVAYIGQILVLPNIEFRLTKLVLGSKEKELKWNRKVNYHLILSNEIPIPKVEELISSLQFETTAYGGEKQTRALTEANLIELGNQLQQEQSQFREHSPLFVGMVNISLDEDKVLDALKAQKSNFEGRYLFGFPADEDLSGVDWLSQGHLTRKNLIKKSNFIFSPNPNTIDFGLGRKHDNVDSFLNEFDRLKPCVWGCDAHSIEKLFEPDQKRYTWIKSANTFEGLRQILHEPDDRVRIQENIPETKTPYLVIDRVRFIDTSVEKIFQSEWIRLNENLNVIIGGKSSGKSLLLHHIAKAIDPEQVKDKAEIVSFKGYDLPDLTDFEVHWNNDDVDKLSVEHKAGQVTYVPQLYVNALAEDEAKSHLNQLIHSILLQNDFFKTFYEETEEQKRECEGTVRECVHRILTLRRDYQDKSNEAKAIGTMEQIDGEILRLEGVIATLRKSSGFTDVEETQFQALTKLVTQSEKGIADFSGLKTQVVRVEQQIKGVLENASRTIDQQASTFAGMFEPTNLQVIVGELKNSVDALLVDVVGKLQGEIIRADAKIGELRLAVTNAKERLRPLETKVSNKALLTKEQADLTVQRQKKNSLTQAARDLGSILEQGKSAKTELFAAYDLLFEIYKRRLQELQADQYVNVAPGLTLKSTLCFDTDRFHKSFTNLFDLRYSVRDQFLERFDQTQTFIFELASHVGNISIIYNNLPKLDDAEGETLKSATNIEDVYTKLFDDYFEIDYTIEHKGDNILQMSPGKRGVVLLQLILHISNAMHPILIDQPEDNLDNRTIYQELKQFIKDKKKERQIIVVTHNANLVVSTDAENVIVANQADQQIGRDRRKYKFEYISGPLENTFRADDMTGILFKMGIREHVCDILEGGKEAFIKREEKYGFR